MIPSLIILQAFRRNKSPGKRNEDARAFLSFSAEKNFTPRRMALLFGILFYGIFGFVDNSLLGRFSLYVIFTARYLVIIPLAFLILGFSYRTVWVQRHFEGFISLLISLAAISMVIMVVMAETEAILSHFMFGLLLVLFVGYSLFRFFFFWAAVTGGIIITAFLCALPWMPLEPSLRTAYVLQLICAYVASMIGAFAMESASYRDYLSRKDADDQRNKLNALNAELETRVEERIRIYNEKAEEAEELLRQQQIVERTLRMTEKQHRDLLEIVEDACFEMDLEGRVKFFNTALCRITGRHASEIRANRFFCWLNVDDGTLLRKRMESMGHVGGTSILSLSLEKPDGEILRIRLSLSPVEDGESRISGFRCVGRDVSREAGSTGHKGGDKPFRPDSEHLGFLRHMAHSMRTPLNAFVGGLHLLAGNGCGSVHSESLGEAAERMQRVLEDMQDYIQMMEGQWLPYGGIFSPEEAASEICTRYRRWSESRNLDFVFETRSLPPSIQGNEGFFRGSLGKLLDNALRFTERGRIEVFLGCRNIAGSLWLSMEISDTGCGMNEETLALALASPFRMEFQKEHREGLGLGLAFIRMMIEEMGGTLRIRSKPGNGTQVICEMPVKEAVEVLSRPLAEEEEGDEELRILLVEDNIINQKITMKLLDTKGHLADLAENGFEALEKVKAHIYDLVLMDIQMPGMDGITATRKIREGFCGDKKKKVPIVAFTAHVSARDRQACLDAGMEDVLTKPVKPADLHAMLRKWTRWQPKDL